MPWRIPSAKADGTAPEKKETILVPLPNIVETTEHRHT